MKAYFYGIATGILVTLAVGLALYLNRSEPKPTTRIVYSDHPLPKKLRTPAVPWVRVYYRRTTDTVHVRVPVPVGFRVRGVFDTDAVSMRRRYVSIRYWSPDSLRFVEDRFAFPVRRWGFWIDAEAGHWRDLGFYAATQLNVRRDAWSAFVGTAVYTDGGPALRFGIRRRVLGVY